MALFPAGSHIIAGHDIYGGTYRLFASILSARGLTFSFVDMSDPRHVREAIRPETRAIWIETPSNPLLGLVDIAAICAIARKHGQLTIVDNTFMSPIFQKPLALGADIVVHSTTKYLNGHSDMVGGVVVTSDEEFAEKLRFLQNAAGAVPGPMDCFLCLRGTKTLAVRMKQHEASARELAKLLEGHKAVSRVFYPGLASHPQHELAKRQASGFGGMISFIPGDGSLAAGEKVFNRFRLFTRAESLGGVESLVCHPASMTHASVPRETRLAQGFADGLLRLSVGIEDLEDLLADLDQSLQGV
jgi:cystathionine beta-lyase/cystathionine gamma-synthase